MSRPRRSGMKAAPRTLTTTTTTVLLEEEPKPEPKEHALERVLAKVDPVATPAAEKRPARPAPKAVPVLRTARLTGLLPGKAEVTFRGEPHAVEAELGDGVARELLVLAAKNRDSVLVEWSEGVKPIIVGVLQTRIPDELVLKGRTITIEAEDEVTLRAGPSAMRLRKDGEVEVVGSRIAMASRGLFRVVGRILRLN